MFTILRPTSLVLLFLLSCVAKVFAVDTYVYEVDANGKQIANPVVHCTGEVVRYQVNTNSAMNNRTRVDVTGGDIVEYSYPNSAPSNGAAGTSERVSSHEVVMGFHDQTESHTAYFKVQWGNLYEETASIRAVIYEEDYSIGWTETSTETRFNQPLFLVNAFPNVPQGTYTVCNSNTVTVSISGVVGAVSYTWTTDNPALQINGSGTYYPTTTTSPSIQVKLPANSANGDVYTIRVKATGSCGSSTPATSVGVQQNCSSNSAANVTFVQSSTSNSCQPRYNVRVSAIQTATSYTATLHDRGIYEGATKTVQAVPYAYYIDFPFEIVGPYSGISASVTVTSPGGTSAPTYSTVQNLAGGSSGCRSAQAQPVRIMSEEVTQSVYPNPATDQVVIAGVQVDAQVGFYNALGICSKRVALSKDVSAVNINLLDLPAGTYVVRIAAGTKVLRTSQLVVKH